MTERVIVRHGAYHDSVTLMLVSRTAGREEGAETVAVGMATPLNLELLADQGFTVDDAGPNDLVIAIRARDEAAADAAASAVDRELTTKGGQTPLGAAARSSAVSGGLAGKGGQTPLRVSLRSAAAGASLAFLSIPGEHVAYEAAVALEAGMHVFCFSDGVEIEVEAALKRRAVERGLLFMGADCGTAILDGVALGFANAVERGPVGIVGASGTGIQEVSCLLDAAGIGISHAIGVGGRDLSAEVGGVMMRRGLELLAADEDTEAIVAISKPPDPGVATAIEEIAAAAGKPVVLGFLGEESPPRDELPGVERVATLEGAAARAAQLVGGALPAFDAPLRRPPSPGRVVGLYSGGTLCAEAEAIVGGGEFTDFGADEFTRGRAHPMIDPSLRLDRLAAAAQDSGVAALLLDVVLGYGAHPDPAGELAPVIEAVDQHVIVALCGAAGDPQGLDAQRARLESAGAVVTRSNAHAARLAREAAGG